MSKFVNESWLVLTMGVVFACLLAGTQTSLSERIKENQRRALNEAIAEVVPDLVQTEQLEIDETLVYKCLDAEGNLAGWAVDASGGGFVDKIRLVVGLSPDGTTITGLKVIENVETPGLGNKIEDPQWAGQYTDVDATKTLQVKKGRVDSSRNEVQAITGATYSSRYVTDIVNDVIERICPRLRQAATTAPASGADTGE